MERPAPRAADEPALQSIEGRALGSSLRLTVSGGTGPPALGAAWTAVQDVFGRVDAAMSRFREDGELTRLNRGGGRLPGASAWLRRGLVAADRANRVTGGRFDARVALDLDRLGAAGVPQGPAWTPDPRRPARLVTLDRRTGGVTTAAPIDLGGIGKGLALRWAARAVEAVLPGRGFLLDAGGDLVAHGWPGDEPWSVGIEDPRGGSTVLVTCVLGDGDAIATSSVRVGRWRDPRGRVVHHLIDPRTGEPGGTGLASVTVAWRDPAWAEVWSKALFLAGGAGIAAEARRRDLAAWWVTDDGDVSMTPAARERTTWVRAEAEVGSSPLAGLAVSLVRSR